MTTTAHAEDERRALGALLAGSSADPFSFLGMHVDGGRVLVRAFAPNADSCAVIDVATGARHPLARIHAAGVFASKIGAKRKPFAYRLAISRAGFETEIDDPYRFGPVLEQAQIEAFAAGAHAGLADLLGAHPCRLEDVDGYRFAVWAPRASRVSVVGDFNLWDGRVHPMRRRDAGVWELFVPGLRAGGVYKYEIVGREGAILPLKADPLARAAEHRPATGSVLAAPLAHAWGDGAWMAGRARMNAHDAPISIYEMHLGSWRRDPEGRPLSYTAIADQLIAYLDDMGFTHVQFLPVSEHPFDGSWGYQPTALFAPTSRHGPPEDFARLVDRLHQAGIGVLIDFVPAHFPTDAHGLATFDGEPLYEHPDPRRGFHPDWNTAIYDFGRPQVDAFLTAAALNWLDAFHADGLRVDAVSSMLYLDYSRKAGEWLPNAQGGNENLEAITLLRRINAAAHEAYPGVLVAAEESTAWPKVSRLESEGGLGFDYKWNMGWMHDTLSYMSKDPVHRRWAHGSMTFPIVYAWSETWILPLSHDEVVHGKGSLLQKMPGDRWRQFANLRAYLAYMWAHPGKKLVFMGAELAQAYEWRHDEALDWACLTDAFHCGVQSLVRRLNQVLRAEPALHERDADPDGFSWVQPDAKDLSVFAFLRWDRARAAPILAVFNFTPVPRPDYRVGVPLPGSWDLLLSTDDASFAGTGQSWGKTTAGPIEADGHSHSLTLDLAPLAGAFFRWRGL